MDVLDIINKKKNKGILSKEEIDFMISEYTNGQIMDYQMSAFLMAVCINKMNDDEIYYMTTAMRDSGETLDLSGIKGVVVDKHSTGGVGDKVSLVLGPAVAACKVPVAKMSGRGLGFTGGTIDKLESFTGFNTEPTTDEFIKNVNEIGISWAGQTKNLAPADKKLYALRDVTATVDSKALIAASIMSKKLAGGAAGIVLDVTYGSGAFMKTKEEAKELAEIMVKIGQREGRKMSAVVTSMEQPLGYAVGNILEVKEAIDILNGKGPKDVRDVSVEIGAHMLVLNGKCDNLKDAKDMLNEAIDSGSALDVMAKWIERQGGSSKEVYDYNLLEKSKYEMKVISEKDGNVKKINALEIGNTITLLGGGRKKKGDDIDKTVGVVLEKKVGNYVKKGEALATVYASDEVSMGLAVDNVKKAYVIENN